MRYIVIVHTADGVPCGIGPLEAESVIDALFRVQKDPRYSWISRKSRAVQVHVLDPWEDDLNTKFPPSTL